MTAEKEQEIDVMAYLYNGCSGLLNEVQRRLMLGEMALKANCRGVIARLSRYTGVSFRTIKRGMEEARSTDGYKGGRVRVAGGGRKRVVSIHPDILKQVHSILDEATYGSPESGRRWTSLSHQDIADELQSRYGIKICANTAGNLIEQLENRILTGMHNSNFSMSKQKRSWTKASQLFLLTRKRRRILETSKTMGRNTAV